MRSSPSNESADTLYFDAFTEIGPRRRKHPAQPWRLEDLLEEMDHCSISGALVCSTQSVLYDAHFGNLDLCRKLKAHPHLFPIWNVLPAYTGEFPEPGDLRKQMEEHQVAAAILHPSSNAWDWEADCSGELLEMLEATATPTFDPTHDSQDELARLIPGTYADRRFICMKPYFHYGVEYHPKP